MATFTPMPEVLAGPGLSWKTAMAVCGWESAAPHSDPSALCKVGEESLRCFGVHDGFTCARGLSNMASPDGYLWVGSTEGICRWKPGNRPEAELLPSLLRRKGLSRVTGLASVADGELWAGLDLKGSGAGLLRLENGRWRSYVTPRSMAGTFPSHCFLRSETARFGLEPQTRVFTGLRAAGWITSTPPMASATIMFFPCSRITKVAFGLLLPKGIDHFRDYAVLSFTASEGSLADHATRRCRGPQRISLFGSSILTRLTGEADPADEGQPRQAYQGCAVPFY